MQLNKIEFGAICFVCFVVGLLFGGIFIDVSNNQEIFRENYFQDKTCEETLLDCYITLQEYVVDYNESRNYLIDPA